MNLQPEHYELLVVSRAAPVEATHSTPGEETHSIASAARRPLHTMHLLTPLRLALWLDGPSYAEARLHGHLVVSRPAATERDDDGTLLRRHDPTLHPNPSPSPSSSPSPNPNPP